MEKTIAERLTKFCLELEFQSIPLDVVEKSKDLLLDTLGICIVSSQLEFGQSVLDIVQAWAGTREGSLVGSEAKVPAHNAAFANGVLAHGLDYDDTHTESVVHPSACLVPVALAVGEERQSSGKEVATALVAGLELMIRIGMPALNKFHLRGFHTTSICGTFASALLAGKLMDLNEERINHALGICGSFTCGLLECLSYGSWAKRLHAGWAGQSGIVAVQLAQSNYTGPMTVFEGRLGLYNSFLGLEELDLEDIFDGLGSTWEVLNIRSKLYPCCHYLQSFLDCAALLKNKHGVDPGSIERIMCKVSEGAANIVCEPWGKKLLPETGYDARFSLPYAISLIFTKNRAGFDEFSEKYLQDREIKRLMEKVSYEIEPTFTVKDMPGALKVVLDNGIVLEHQIPQVRGDRKNPISRDEIINKFRSNCSDILDKSHMDEIIKLVLRLEKIDDIGRLMILMKAVK